MVASQLHRQIMLLQKRPLTHYWTSPLKEQLLRKYVFSSVLVRNQQNFVQIKMTCHTLKEIFLVVPKIE